MRSITFKALGLTSNTRKHALLCGIILASASMACKAGAYTIPQFSTGSDISYYPDIQANGGTYSYNGQQTGILGAMTDAGVNTARIRLFVNATPAEVQQYGTSATENNLAYDLPMLQKVDAAGLYSVLNMHLSPTWASPGEQNVPSSWGGYNLSQMENALYNYCDNTITTLRNNNAMPAMVTVGNEINNGILWPTGGTQAGGPNWSTLPGLLTAAINGIDAGSNGQAPAIMLTYGEGNPTSFFQTLSNMGVKYNVIGYDYYPQWGGSLGQLQSTLKSLSTLGKPIVLAETSYPYTTSTSNSGYVGQPNFSYAFTPAGQAQYAAALIATVKATPNGLGRGVWWWGGEMMPLANPNYFLNSWSYTYGSLFDQNGNALPVLNTLGESASGVPEPGSLALLVAAAVLVLLGGCARRMNRYE